MRIPAPGIARLIPLALLPLGALGAQPPTVEFVACRSIRTVTLHRLGVELSEPTLELHSSERLLLTFDDVGETPRSFSYTILHCDSDWNPSPIFHHDFMEGFEVNEVRDFAYSTATLYSYAHFRLELPNADVRFRVSGNYLLRVFSSHDPETILFQRRFVVYEPLVAISMRVRQPHPGEWRLTGQQLEVRVHAAPLRLSSPLTEVKLVVCQNHPFQGCIAGVQPVHIRDGVLDYVHPNALIFEGVNEFRLFDIMSTRYPSQGVRAIDFVGGMLHAQLTPDQGRNGAPYSSYSDLNGRFVIRREHSAESHLEADYLWVYFTLNAPQPLPPGQHVYLFGELTGWQLSPANRMTYSHDRQAYEIRLLLKQGAYSYRYVVAHERTGRVDPVHFEGSHFSTENDYMAFVYYQPLGARFQRVVGFTRVSSAN